jgi:hypothetical protein
VVEKAREGVERETEGVVDPEAMDSVAWAAEMEMRMVAEWTEVSQESAMA